MIIELLVNNGGILRPVTVHATQVIVKNDVGTPIYVAGKYGPENGQLASSVTDPDFNDTMKKLGIHMTVICDRLILPAANGPRILPG